MADPADQRPGDGLAGLLEIPAAEVGDGRASVRLAMRDELTGPGGQGVASAIYAAVAEAICASATRQAISSDTGAVEPLTSQTSVLATAPTAHIDAVATARHRGRTTWVWDVEFRDGDGDLRATTRLTLAIRARSARADA